MKTKISKAALAAALISLTAFSGCFSVNREFKDIRNQFMEGMNTGFNREIEFSVGPAGVLFASMFVRLAGNEPNLDELIAQVNRIQLGIYKPEETDYMPKKFGLLKDLADDMKSKGWSNIVRTMEGNEMACVFVRDFTEEEGFKEMFILALNDDGLILVQIHGDLDRLIEIAMRENGLKLEVVKN